MNSLPSSIIEKIWHYNLLQISGHEIKVNNIIIAFILFITGIKLAKKLTRFIVRIMAQKLQDNAHNLQIIEYSLSYTFLIIVILITLQAANIPLGIFAFIGGAVAIGVGLGMQEMVSGFINTIIIMLEKPVKIGDIIEMKDAVGRVKSIGTRCIIIDSFDSKEILIPSKELIQKQFSKWTIIKNKVNYQFRVNILKNDDIKIDHKLISDQLVEIAKNLKFSNIEVYLTKITEEEDQFCLSCLTDISLFKSTNDLKNKINLALLESLKGKFSVEYSSNMGTT